MSPARQSATCPSVIYRLQFRRLSVHDQEWEIAYYKTQHGHTPFREWVESLHDFNARAIIYSRLDRLRLGNFGKCTALGPGIYELKIYYGPGYRVYFGRAGGKIILLLCGGDKSTQPEDIRKAYDYWRNYKEQ